MNIEHGVIAKEGLSGARAVQGVSSSVIGAVGTIDGDGADGFPLNTPVEISRQSDIAALGDSGTLIDTLRGAFDQVNAKVIVVRTGGSTEAEKIDLAAGNSVAKTGVHALLSAESLTSFKPQLLVASGLTHQRPGNNANPVVAQLKTVTQKLRSVAFVDGPSTSDQDARLAAEEAGSDRIYVCDPFVMVSGANGAVPRPASSRFAGVQARVDREHGFWWSLSNKPINGIVGVARPIEFGVDETSQAGGLNAANVGTVIFNNGYRTWGNRGAGNDPATRFLSVRRTTDLIADEIERSFLWAVDRPINGNTVTSIQSSLTAYIRRLTAIGAILGGSVYLNPELNTRETLAAGQLFIDVEFEPPAPGEGITVRLSRNNGFYDEVFRQIAA